ncbi:MAG: hypothetical protein JW829_12075 [Pirellulales bacterium]|nr:hypothetical protein [Pirellulales bacterium]
MKAKMIATTIIVLVWSALPSIAYAQKGMGDTTGIVRQAIKPEIVSIPGTVLEVMTGPCKATTGRSLVGTHVLLKTEDGNELNIHLGPAVAVEHIAKKLVADARVTANVFRTDKMPENAYVAQTIVVDNETLQLRDENCRPVWAGNRPFDGSRMGPGWGAEYGQGRGPARGAGYGQGRGPARGAGYGQGRGQGPSAGYGQGRGPARGAGYGQGRGQGRGARYGQGRGAGYGQCPWYPW